MFQGGSKAMVMSLLFSEARRAEIIIENKL